MVFERELRLYELICSRMNICFMLDVNINGLNKEILGQSLNYVRIKHPYLSMKIVQNPNCLQQFKFVKLNDEEILYLPIEEYKIKEESEFDNWRERLINVARIERNFTKSLIFLDIYSLNDTNKHKIYCCVNHAGIDGPGLFTIAKDLLYYLDLILFKSEIEVIPRNFEDIHKEYNTEKYDLEKLKAEEIIKENYLPSLNLIPDEEDSDPYVSGEFYQFDEETTNKLIKNCRHFKATIQGAISIATLIGLLNTHNQDVKDPIQTINAVPCNMRGLIEPKLTNDDCVCGSAALIWPQTVKGNDNIWDLVSEATKNIHKLRDDNYGYKWWIKIVNGIELQSYSIMSSSIGVIDLNEKSLKNITINDVRMLGGSYLSTKTNAGNMTHVITALNKLTVVMSYSYPALSKAWAKKFAYIQSEVLKYFANFDTNNDISKNLKEILDQFKI